MRRGAVVVLALAAALAAPLRAACATTCVDTPEARLASHPDPDPPAPATTHDAQCHEPAKAPAGDPAVPCGHDHDTSLKPAVRSNAETTATAQPPVAAPFFVAASGVDSGTCLVVSPLDVTRGSPPLRHLPLRI